ncbi:O-antigen ligase [Bryocella elongata]|uniref:O-antigen ligase n=1 Tax=Bryocella elongata TaxID=863522 RepID=A0A1H5WG05_9BACT|nr:O-antigen ligase [Bryocella elongata]SEF98280.1 O-antigen ligase [Bryocella elongata]
MSLLLSAQVARAELQKAALEQGRADYRLKLIKIVCAVLLGVCFWYSVPYYLPLKVDPDPLKAAANEAQAYEGNFSRQVAMPIVLVIATFMLWRLPKRGRFGGPLMFVAIGYVAWSFASFGWSEDPAITGKRLVVFGIDAFFAYVIARVYSNLEIALWGFLATGTVAMISFYVDWLQEGIFQPFNPDYRFTGVMTANYQAMNLLVCTLCGLTLCMRRPEWRSRLFPFLAFILALLFFTRARMGAFICLGLVVIMFTRMTKRQMRPADRAMLLLASVMIAVPGLILVLGRNAKGAATDIFMMGRTDTQNTSSLSNRAPLWSELMESVEEKPWLGFGYEAFWEPKRVEKVSADQGWMVPHAHNTFLDQTLSLGVVGALLYAGMMVGALVIAWKRYRRTRSESDMLPAVLLTWLVLTSLAESTPLDPYLPSMFVYISVVKMCMREGSEAESDLGLGPKDIIGGIPLQPTAANGRRYPALAGDRS